MYMVVSRWETGPDGQDEFVRRAMIVRESICKMPGVVDATGFVSHDGIVDIVLTFEDEEAYERLYERPDSPYALAIQEQRLDYVGRWMGTDQGELVPPKAGC